MEVILAHTRLTSGFKCIGLRIALHRNAETGRCNPSMPRLAAGTDTDVRTVERGIKAIEAEGLLRRVSTRGRTSNTYILVLPAPTHLPGFDEANPDSAAGVEFNSNPGVAAGVTPTQLPVQPRLRRRANNQQNHKENHQDNISESERATKAEFQSWFASYPKQEGEVAARREYWRARKKGASAAELMEGARRYAVQVEAQGREDRFISAPSRWLADARWKDRPSSAAASNGAAERMTSPVRSTTSNLEIAMRGLRR